MNEFEIITKRELLDVWKVIIVERANRCDFSAHGVGIWRSSRLLRCLITDLLFLFYMGYMGMS